MVEVAEPVLVRNVTHTIVGSLTNEFERVTFSLSTNEAIAIHGARWHGQNSFPPTDQVQQGGISLDAEVNDASFSNLMNDDGTIYSFTHSFDLVSTGSGEVRPYDHFWFDRPVIVASDISYFYNSNNIGGVITIGIYYQKLRLSDAELVRQVALRR